MIEFMSVYDFPPIRKSSKINYRIFFRVNLGWQSSVQWKMLALFACVCVCVCVANSVS